MEGRESMIDILFEDDEGLGDDLDVKMADVEEGELIDLISNAGLGESFDVGGNQVNQVSISTKNPRNSYTGLGESFDVGGGNQVNQESSSMKNPNNRKKKKKNKRKKGNNTRPKAIDVSRFVVDVCKRLKERKHYLMWTAVGLLGVSALSDLVKEVDAIESCGGQKTADGKCFRKGGGILWNIIKARDPNAYKEIMTKGKEFEKQFKYPIHDKQASFQRANDVKFSPSDGLEPASNEQSELEKMPVEQKRAAVHDRLRVPVSYDDLFEGGEGDTKDVLA